MHHTPTDRTSAGALSGLLLLWGAAFAVLAALAMDTWHAPARLGASSTAPEVIAEAFRGVAAVVTLGYGLLGGLPLLTLTWFAVAPRLRRTLPWMLGLWLAASVALGLSGGRGGPSPALAWATGAGVALEGMRVVVMALLERSRGGDPPGKAAV